MHDCLEVDVGSGVVDGGAPEHDLSPFSLDLHPVDDFAGGTEVRGLAVGDGVQSVLFAAEVPMSAKVPSEIHQN